MKPEDSQDGLQSMTNLRAEAPAFIPGGTATAANLSPFVGEPSSSRCHPHRKSIGRRCRRHRTQEPVGKRSCETDRTSLKGVSQPRYPKCLDGVGRRRNRAPPVTDEGSERSSHDGRPTPLQTFDDQSQQQIELKEKEEFPALGTTVKVRVPEIWALTERIQSSVACEWQPEADERAIAPALQHSNIEEVAAYRGLELLTKRCEKRNLGEAEETLTEGTSISDDPSSSACWDSTLPMRRRLDIAKLRDKMFQNFEDRCFTLQHQEAVSEPDRTDGESATEDPLPGTEAQFTVWEYVPLSPYTSSDTSSPLAACYHDSESPLLLAIENNDIEAVQSLLRTGRLRIKEARYSPIQLAVLRRRPQLLRQLLKSPAVEAIPEGTGYPPASHLAAKNKDDDCLQLLLSHSTSSVLTKDVHNGNNLLHVCCGHSAQISTMQLVLYMISNSSSTLLSKAMLSTNDRGETPMHIACRKGLTAQVEVLLSKLSFSLLSKVFTVKDENEHTPFLAAVVTGSTNVVMSIFMWRGNNQIRLSSNSLDCPLLWAIRARHIDMVMLLLEFNAPSGRGYNLVRALCAALDNPCTTEDPHQDDKDIAELCRILVQAGANPCEVDAKSGETCIALAVRSGRNRSLGALIDSYDSQMELVRTERRRDPLLQKQPESFFEGLECRETVLRSSALRDSLIHALYRFYTAQSANANASLSCALTLFSRGAKLDALALSRLTSSIRTKCIHWDPDQTTESAFRYSYRVDYPDAPSVNNEMHWSLAMLHMPWIVVRDIQTKSSCLFARVNCGRGSFPRPDTILVTGEGSSFAVHSVILAERSEKLAAARRFHHLVRDNELIDFKVEMEATTTLCRLFLEHIYHGSILSLSIYGDDPAGLVNLLLDLLVMADEYILPTLTQECVARLLSSDPYQCFCRTCAKDVYNTTSSHYQVSSEAVCINAKTCLDILAAVQHVRHHGSSCATSMTVTWEENSLWGPVEKMEMSVDSIDALNEAVHRYILMNFDEILRLDKGLSVQGSDESRTLLWVCLNELTDCPIGVRESHARPSSVHGVDGSKTENLAN